MASLIGSDFEISIPLMLIVLFWFSPKSERDLKIWKENTRFVLLTILGASAVLIWSHFQQTRVADANFIYYSCIAYIHHIKPQSGHAICDWQSHMAGMACGLVIVCCTFIFINSDIFHTSCRTIQIAALLINTYSAYLH
jgi:hypothetical protein